MDFHEKIEAKQSQIDEKKMGWSMTQILKELVDHFNSEMENKQSTDKLSHMEIELGEIANNVKKNISDIFERGERFGVLVSKSEALKTAVSKIIPNRIILSFVVEF